ncbi:hypothetical protein [Flavobacterium phragmitis]|uniref:Uncharacterized protein n=1 Tax=Flavobacterium phragmitis TaxID=739143 RepID=A0A1I1X850_9FLAO|nr:hypothetical protein [Flavobacterium phragmitis]SFE01520.1 hypothetical protein SAMN05216297_11826 [Flavobacterium phragmitis]
MKKAVLIYNGLTYLICFCVSTAQMFISGVSIEMSFLFLFCVVSLIHVYFIFENKFVKESFIFLGIINLVQSISFMFLGLTYKFIIGLDLSLYLIDAYDNYVNLSFKPFNIFTDVSFNKSNTVSAVAVNFIHLFCSFFCYRQLNKGN